MKVDMKVAMDNRDNRVTNVFRYMSLQNTVLFPQTHISKYICDCPFFGG